VTILKKAVMAGLVASFAFVGAAYADGHLSLAGKRIGIAVVGVQHFWDREAFNGAVSTVEKLGGEVMAVDGGRDNQVHAENHDILLAAKVDAVITILGDGAVEPKLQALQEAGIPVFTVDHPSPFAVNNTTSDNYYMGSTIGRYMADAIGGEGKVAVFNAFEGALRICGIRVGLWKYVLADYPGIEIIQPELAEEFANAPEDARKQTLDLLSQYPEGTLDAIHVGCWDQPAIGIVQALEEGSGPHRRYCDRAGRRARDAGNHGRGRLPVCRQRGPAALFDRLDLGDERGQVFCRRNPVAPDLCRGLAGQWTG